MFAIEVELYNKSEANQSAELGLIYDQRAQLMLMRMGDNDGPCRLCNYHTEPCRPCAVHASIYCVTVSRA